MYQYEALKAYMPFSSSLSPASAWPRLTRPSTRDSAIQYSIAAVTPTAATPVASHSGSCQLEYSGLAKEVDQSAEAEPSRASDRLMPKAKLSSLPLTHLASAAVGATISGSAPMPSRKRPASMVSKRAVEAISAAAARQITANRVIERLVPQRSIT